jgi:secreted trypsin-like serine protease
VLVVLGGCAMDATEELADVASDITNASQSSGAPEAVMLEINGAFCTGLVLTKNWIVTAGHCTTGKTRVQVTMRQSDGTDLVTFPSGAATFYTHPSFTPDSHDYNDDIGLIRLPGSGMSAYLTARIYVDAANEWDSSSSTAHVWGWGRGTDPSRSWTCDQLEDEALGALPGETLKVKRWASLRTRTDSTSLRARMTQMLDSQGQIMELCGGDSGAPVFLNRDSALMAYAVYNGNPSGVAEGTAIKPKLNWIEETTINASLPISCLLYTNTTTDFRRCQQWSSSPPPPVVTM